MASDRFYEQLPSFKRFGDFCIDAPYVRVPESWWVLVTDIRGSTALIEKGRYRDVNMAGASSIAAVLNEVEVAIPFVFGGDGATFLIPHDSLERVKSAILKTKLFIEQTFAFEMRAGAVPMSEIQKRGGSVEVAKFELSPDNAIAFFKGGGLVVAENLIKKSELSEVDYEWRQEIGTEASPNLEGLSCRWKPLPAKNGTILNLLVRAVDPANAGAVYTMITDRLHKILDTEDPRHAPTGEESFKHSWLPSSWQFENKWKFSGLSWKKKMKAVVRSLIFDFIVHLSIRFEFNLKSFDPKKYKRELKANSDFRKFDDMLRMVLDCSPEQALKIHNLLSGLQEQDLIYYGIHQSKHALMTCLVFSAVDSKHVHFIDGSDGGYAAAAVHLKEQMKK